MFQWSGRIGMVVRCGAGWGLGRETMVGGVGVGGSGGEGLDLGTSTLKVEVES